MIQLKEFQKSAADQIAERFGNYYDDPPMRGTRKNRRTVPFYQELASIPASGKTVILSDAVSAISTMLPIAPIVLWLSKGKVVVDQTATNLAPGGKYHHLLGTADFNYLAEYDATVVRNATNPLIFFATVGTFNQKDKEEGSRLIFKSEVDTADESTWNELKQRRDAEDHRRPLIIVYDEGHNLTDQQIDLLLDLEPDGLIAASATMKLPAQLDKEIKQLRDEGWKNEDLVTKVDPKAVAESELVKSCVQLSGYEAPMEETINSLIDDMRDAEKEATECGVGAPKAIYVCKTNIVDGDSSRMDRAQQPFLQRRAPPILIWRHLTERCGVDPSEIAVYCSLKTHKDYPMPADFRLFKGGEKDYAAFTDGDYRHVIFNLSLQEGWDDPLCYFAYIDKSMESTIQVEQVVGRLLRQPSATHYRAERLNTAHIYVRVDKRGVFTEVLKKVNKQLARDVPGIRIVETKLGKSKPESIPVKGRRTIPETAHVTDQAVEPIAEIVDSLPDFRNDDGSNIASEGGRAIIQHFVGEDSEVEFEWEEFEHTSFVVARWLFQREIMRRFQGALGIAPTDAPKFDAMVGFGSRAHKQIVRTAQDVVDAYLDNVYIKQKKADGYTVGSVLVRKDDLTKFDNALHAGYSGLNETLELPFAEAIDKIGVAWCRNPASSKSGYTIPLISVGATRNFYPDFLIWKGKDVYAVDTTGEFLLQDKTSRKLLAIEPATPSGGRLIVRLISGGIWNADVEREDSAGYTVWGRKQDNGLRTIHVDTPQAAVRRALTRELI